MCKVWDLTGISYYHACATIYFSNLHLKDYVSECFKKETFNLVLGPEYWPSTPYSQIQPLIIKDQPGR